MKLKIFPLTKIVFLIGLLPIRFFIFSLVNANLTISSCEALASTSRVSLNLPLI
ncbi:MAG: hypothetical protein MJ200_05230 [Mycoplasmoidaceae bacterium]|nr:hypothetical protein [Mycoplasmoidaceae bacterium]